MKQSMRELEKAREAYGYLCEKSKDGISARMNDCDTWDPYSGKK